MTHHLFMATLSTETNTFAPMPTGMQAYHDYFYREGTATQEPATLMTEALHVWRAGAAARGWQVTESLTAIAEPAGLTTRKTYERLRDHILDDLRRAGQPTLILLQLHGAMVADGYDDCEADLVGRVRALCPDAFIGIALDLHCHLTQGLLDVSNAIITMKEYPHDDVGERAQELFDLAVRALSGTVRPTMALFDCRMISLFLTKEGAMKGFVQRMKDTEQHPEILSVSLGHGFPWADLPEVGARLLVVADNDADLAARAAAQLGQAFFDLRHELAQDYPALSPALDQYAMAEAFPITLADMSDNSGAGAPGDSTFVLREVMDRGLCHVALGIIWDPMAVHMCVEAGTGACLRLRIGGKSEIASGDPLDVSVTVRAIRTGLVQHLGAGAEPLGTLVHLTLAGGVDVLINDLRIQVYHPEVFEQMGIDLTAKRLIVVKSLFHFYSPFAALSQHVIFCATPGRVNPDTRAIAYTRRDLNFWPRVENPFAPNIAAPE